MTNTVLIVDGTAFMKAVKSLPNHKFTPIVMLSAGSLEASHQEAREAGVKAWVVKPFGTGKLPGMVSRFACAVSGEGLGVPGLCFVGGMKNG